MKTLLTILLLIHLASCKTLLTSKYKFNRPFNFSSRAEYLGYLEKSFTLLPHQIYYVDSTDQNAFFVKISTGKLAEYYGAFLNDSTEIKKSASLSENLSCIGRVLREITNNITIQDSSLLVRSDLRKFKFQNALDDSPLTFENDNKVKIILLYGFAMGNYFTEFYKEISVLARKRKDSITIYIISLDPLQSLTP